MFPFLLKYIPLWEKGNSAIAVNDYKNNENNK